MPVGLVRQGHGSLLCSKVKQEPALGGQYGVSSMHCDRYALIFRRLVALVQLVAAVKLFAAG